jgi:hypothetical protein
MDRDIPGDQGRWVNGAENPVEEGDVAGQAIGDPDWIASH